MSPHDYAAPPAYAREYPELVIRAASLLIAKWPAKTCVTFPMWSDGSDSRFTATLRWDSDQPTPRVVVVDARSGEFKCQSLASDWFEMDCSKVGEAVATDEVDRWAFGQAKQRAGGKRK